MKTLKPVDEETYAKIGKAYQICSQYPEVFGEVTMKKFCSMFVDVIDEDEDEREARMRKYAPDMYQILKDVSDSEVINIDIELGKQLEDAIYAVLKVIDGEEAEE